MHTDILIFRSMIIQKIKKKPLTNCKMLIFLLYYSEKQRKAEKLVPFSLLNSRHTYWFKLFEKAWLVLLARALLSKGVNSYN